MNKELQELEIRLKICRGGANKERLQQIFERCKVVDCNINLLEMELIWYIRQSRTYNAFRYLLVAKKIYEAELAFKELVEADNNLDNAKPKI